MYGLIGKRQAQPGRRDELLGLLQEAADLMALGSECAQWLIHAVEGDDVWITELWTTQEAHDASLQQEAIRAIIGRAMPLLAESPQAGASTRLHGGFTRAYPSSGV